MPGRGIIHGQVSARSLVGRLRLVTTVQYIGDAGGNSAHFPPRSKRIRFVHSSLSLYQKDCSSIKSSWTKTQSASLRPWFIKTGCAVTCWRVGGCASSGVHSCFSLHVYMCVLVFSCGLISAILEFLRFTFR
jgi:hypothetical protein